MSEFIHFDGLDSVPLLSEDETTELCARAQAGDLEARKRVVASNLRFVILIARDFTGLGVDFEDLVAEGSLGLFRAVMEFDPARGRFTTCARSWVLRRIYNALNNNAHPVKIPHYAIGLYRRYRRAREELIKSLEREPDLEEVREYLNLKKGELEKIRLVSGTFGVLTPDDGNMDWDDIPEAARLPEDTSQVDEVSVYLRSLLSLLDDRAQFVVRSYYGYGEQHCPTFADISRKLGISRERVRQIFRKSMEELREAITPGTNISRDVELSMAMKRILRDGEV